MKAHIGVDSQSRLIHSVVVTSANMHNSQVPGDLLHGNERRVYGDSAYTGQKSQIQSSAEQAKDLTHKRGRRNYRLTEKERKANRNKSKIRPRVEHLFGVIKHQFGYRKVRYKGLAKNAQAVFIKCALANGQTPFAGNLTGEVCLKIAYCLNRDKEIVTTGATTI